MAKRNMSHNHKRVAKKNPYRLVYGGGPGRGFAVSHDYELPQMAIAEAKALSLPGSYGGEVTVVQHLAGERAREYGRARGGRFYAAGTRSREAKKNARKKKAGGIKLYANPYAFDGKGWYFKDADDFDAKYKKHLPVEEYEIEFIDGTHEEADLFKAMGVSQSNVREFLDVIEQLENDHDQAAFFYVLDNQYYSKDPEGWAEALEKVEDEVRVMEGDAKAYAEEYVDSIGGVKELGKTAEQYFDYEAFGRDLGYDLDPDDENDKEMLDLDDKERGERYVDDVGFESLGKTAENYFDMDSFARDLELGGDVTEFEFAGKTYTTDYHG